MDFLFLCINKVQLDDSQLLVFKIEDCHDSSHFIIEKILINVTKY